MINALFVTAKLILILNILTPKTAVNVWQSISLATVALVVILLDIIEAGSQ
jgi:hypothetical protein